MLHDDIINPLISDFIDLVTGSGYQYFDASATTRLNDFTTYLSSLIPDRQFAFYPFRNDQNVQGGNSIIGIGLLSTGTPVYFPGVVQRSDSGIFFGTRTPSGPFTPSYLTVGMIDFSKNSGISFRGDSFSIFYFLKHIRNGERATSLYRGEGGLCPYFICDKSPDWFQIVAPEFSTSRARPRGTTYIYDEIFGEDKKGLQMDWSQKDSEKYYAPQSISFYDPEKDRPDRFYCLNLNGNFNSYSMRFIYGRDPNLLTGNFPSPYSQVVKENGDVYYLFPNRIVLGAGATNLTSQEFNVDGLDHISPGLLITKGDYGYLGNEIADQMLQGIGLVYQEEPQTLQNPKEFISGSIVKILSLEYFETFPILYNKYPREFLNLRGSISSIELDDYGKWGFTFSSEICGHLGCYGGWIGISPKEITDVRGVVNEPPLYTTGIQITGTYGNLRIGEFWNQGIIGTISGYMDSAGNFSGFESKTISGHSGFYYDGNYLVFPPYLYIASEKIIGYISGILNEFSGFEPFNPFQNNYGSGYFLTGTQVDFTETQIFQKEISGFQFGTLNRITNVWSGFGPDNKFSSSGYILNGEFKEFLPIKTINRYNVTGFWYGTLQAPDYFSGFDNEIDLSGILTTQNPNIFNFTQDGKIFFPSGGNFNGFDDIQDFDPEIGYEFSGFFVESSGFYSANQTEEYPKTGMMTGIIGYKNFIEFFGEFSGSNSITGFDDSFDITYGSFFDGEPYFSGIEFDFTSNEFLNYGSGYLIGKIGTRNVSQYYSDPNFDNRNGFYPEYGYTYTGFSFPEGSGFSGISPNATGRGMITGYIGSRNFIDYSGQYSGFFGLLDNYNKYLPQIIFPNFQFTRGSGFIGPKPGAGLLTGIISTGKVDGDAKFVAADTYVEMYNTGIKGTGINVSGSEFLNIENSGEYSISNISGGISEDFVYLPGTLSGTFFDTGYSGFNSGVDQGIYDIKSGSFVSGGIGSGIYITGVYQIGSGKQFELEQNFRYESGNIVAQILDIEFEEAIAFLYVLQNNIPESAINSGFISSIEYTEQNINYGFKVHTGNISGGISSIRAFSTLINSATGIDSGNYNVFPLYNISTVKPSIFVDSGIYNISGTSMDVFTLFPPIASISYEPIPAVITGWSGFYTVQFIGNNLQTKGIPTVDNWYWDLSGDATPEFNQKEISFTYTTTGTKTVSLTATNASGSSTATTTITLVSGSAIQSGIRDPYSDYVVLLLKFNNGGSAITKAPEKSFTLIESGSNFSVSGLNLRINSLYYQTQESGASFGGASGLDLRIDSLYNKTEESGASFGVSGVILTTGAI